MLGLATHGSQVAFTRCWLLVDRSVTKEPGSRSLIAKNKCYGISQCYESKTPMTNVRKILIVDDDAAVRDFPVEHLALHDGIEATAVESGAKGMQAVRAGQIDLVIMDIGLPDVDGREAVRMLRESGFMAPIIMLTGHSTDPDVILGFESGANDYVVKPFQFAVLLARIRAQLQQHEANKGAGS